MRRAVGGLGAEPGPDAVALLHLVGVGEGLAREHAGVGAETVDLIRRASLDAARRAPAAVDTAEASTSASAASSAGATGGAALAASASSAGP